jgi:hypothetical protein
MNAYTLVGPTNHGHDDIPRHNPAQLYLRRLAATRVTGLSMREAVRAIAAEDTERLHGSRATDCRARAGHRGDSA